MIWLVNACIWFVRSHAQNGSAAKGWRMARFLPTPRVSPARGGNVRRTKGAYAGRANPEQKKDVPFRGRRPSDAITRGVYFHPTPLPRLSTVPPTGYTLKRSARRPSRDDERPMTHINKSIVQSRFETHCGNRETHHGLRWTSASDAAQRHATIDVSAYPSGGAGYLRFNLLAQAGRVGCRVGDRNLRYGMPSAACDTLENVQSEPRERIRN